MMLANEVPIEAAPRPVRVPLGQLVDIPRSIEVQHQIDLKKQILPIGLVGAGGLAMFLGSQLPSPGKWIGMLAGAGLAGGGIYLLFQDGDAAAEAGPPGTGPAEPPASPGTGPTPVETQPPFTPSEVEAFRMVDGEIVSPGWWDEIEAGGIFTESYKVQASIHNPSPVAVTFDLELDVEETPFYAPFNNPGEAVTNNQVQTVTLGAGQQQNYVFTMNLQVPRLAAYAEVRATLFKRRTISSARVRLHDTAFVAR